MAVKAVDARGDAGRKLWYITGVADLEVLEVSLVTLIKISLGAGGLHAAGSSRNDAESPNGN